MDNTNAQIIYDEAAIKKQKKSYYASFLWKLTLAIVIILFMQLILIMPHSIFTGFMSTYSQYTHNGFTNMVAKEAGRLRNFNRPVREQSGIHEKKDDSKARLQQLMLTYLAEYPSIYSQIKDYVSPDDFWEEPYKEVATKFFEDLKNGNASPARMVNMFEDEEVQNTVSNMFTSTLSGVEDKEEIAGALVDIIFRLKSNSLDEKRKSEAGLDPKEYMEKKKELMEIRKIKITIPE